jgi:hypothetical protein
MFHKELYDSVFLRIRIKYPRVSLHLNNDKGQRIYNMVDSAGPCSMAICLRHPDLISVALIMTIICSIR